MASNREWKRRTVLRTGGIVSVSAMAGCLDGDNDGDNSDGEIDGSDDTGGGETDNNDTENDDSDDDGDSPSDDSDVIAVSMPPVGTVEFQSVPENWAANNGSWADMGIALGQQPPEAVFLTGRYHTQYYSEIPDVSVDIDNIESLWDDGLTLEEFIELSNAADVFAMDPNFLKGRAEWSDNDIEQVESTGTPFFGNSIFSRSYSWHDYDYLSLYEAFEKLSQVFDETERYATFESLHDEFQSNVSDVVPAENKRPDVAILWPLEAGAFLPYPITDGTSFKQWRDLGVHDALAGANLDSASDSRGLIGYETLLEIDPDVILCRGHEAVSAEEFQNTVVAHMEDDAGSQLTAVRNGDVYRGGPLYQGPITNLVVTQRAAEQLYGIDEQLYDPQEVSDIVNGDF